MNMSEEEKEKAIELKFLTFRNNLEIANRAIFHTLQTFDSLDDFADFINNWEEYKKKIAEIS